MEQRGISGFSSAAVLLSCSLSAILLAGLVQTLCHASKADILGRQLSLEAFALLRMSQILEDIGHSLDSHRLPILPVLHAAGTITFSDGSPNSVMTGAAPLRPHQQAQALTSLRMAPLHLFDILQCETHGNTSLAYACRRFPDSNSAGPFHGYVAVSLEGPFEVSAQENSSQRCRQVQLEHTRSMSLSRPKNAELCSARLLIPILNHNTIYMDHGGQLRYLSHSGQANIENQPMGRYFSGLTFRLSPANDDHLLGLESILKFPSGRQARLVGTTHLSRQPYYNLLFNLDRL